MPVYSNFKEKAIIEDLEAHGMADLRLQEEILVRIRLGLPDFTIPHKELFGDNEILYKLHFNYDSKAYPGVNPKG